MAVGLAQCHKDARHEGKVKGHMAFVIVTKIWSYSCWPLVRLGKKHACFVVLVEEATHFFEYGMRLGEVFVDCTLTFAQVGYSVQAQAIYTDIEPETHGPKYSFQDLRISVIQVGLM